VAKFRFSQRAEADLLRIGEYTLHKWGEAQTIRYTSELEVCCHMLAKNPALGRRCDDIRPGLRRHEHGRHVIFFRQERAEILISRILHKRMLPEKHAIDDEEQEDQ
jgi:toxin ParE1/3/4